MKSIELELTNICGLNCITCSRKIFSSYGYLNLELLDKIIYFLKINNYEKLVIAGFGDAFLHKDIFLILIKIFSNIRNIKVFIYTKGDSLDNNKINKIIKLVNKGYDLEIVFSIFSFNNKDHNYLTGSNYGYDMVLKKFFILYKKGIKVYTEYLLNSYSYKDLDKYKLFCKKFFINPCIQTPINWGGVLDDKIYKDLIGKNDNIYKNEIYLKKIKNKNCDFYYNDYYQINYKGDIFKCCFFEYDGNLSLGNINNIENIKLKYKSKILEKKYFQKCNTCIYNKYSID